MWVGDESGGKMGGWSNMPLRGQGGVLSGREGDAECTPRHGVRGAWVGALGERSRLLSKLGGVERAGCWGHQHVLVEATRG